MIWSKFNYLLNSEKFGYFVYNSTTNSFFKINEGLFNICNSVKINNSNIKLIDEEIQKEFINSKIIVSKYEEDSYYTKTSYLKKLNSFTQTSLGLVIAPTYTCNFACPYCYEHELPNINMGDDVEDNIIKFIKSFTNVKSVALCWHGGEPLIRFNNIKNILHKIKSEKNINLTKHHLVTNGYLFDQEKCDFFKEHKLNSVQITIDGLPETHNISRKHKSGMPTYDIIIKNIDYMLNTFPECRANIRVNIHDSNKEDFPILKKELENRWEGKNINIHYRYVANHGICQVACLENKNKLQFMIDLYKKHGLKDIEFYPKTELGGCTADYNNSYVIGPKGEMYKCWVDLGKEERIIGNISDNDLNLSLISEYVVGTDKFSDEKCKNCFLFPVCDGGCGTYRLEHKLFGKEYNVCPINPEDTKILLEMFYEQHIEKQKINP
ncbi:MAG: hypothetical protein A2046_12780 [Bacteroidetes bacterium GWA2_30_7]|nr:MAG: hypothetical protein A2046_12780 [Bacteroidetes bacterium GWA2_30_7]